MSKDIGQYLKKLDINAFDEMIPRRRSVINSASPELPQSDFNANRVARALHPEVQYLLVSEIIDHAGDVKSFLLEPAPGTDTAALAYFRAGQYISIKLRIGDSVITRPYSVSSSPAEALKNKYTLTIKRLEDGFASSYIFDHWQVGTVVEASGPQGEFVYEPLRDANNLVALAGGSGITPVYSLAQAIADGTEEATLTILYGSRKTDQIIFKEELDNLAATCGKINVVHVISDEEETKGCEKGFITAELIKKYAPDSDYSIFVSGPAAMYEFLDQELAKLGLPRRRIRYEVFGEYKNPEQDPAFPADAAGKTFQLQVDMHGSKKTVTAKSGESMLVAMERAGIEVPSICRSGECGFCRSRLVSGSHYVPERLDYRRMADVENNFIHPCCTFATGDGHIRVASDEGDIKRGTMDQRKKKVGLIMTLIMSIMMGIVATIISRSGMPPQALATAPPLPAMMFSNVLMSLVVGIIIWLIIPSARWGNALVAKAKALPGTFKFTALNCLPISAVNSVIISMVVSFINVSQSHAQIPAAFAPPLGAMWFGAWIKMLPVMLIIAYITAIIVSPLVVKWAKMPAGPPVKK
jgi:ferredoxin-NADP reductase